MVISRLHGGYFSIIENSEKFSSEIPVVTSPVSDLVWLEILTFDYPLFRRLDFHDSIHRSPTT